MGKWSYRSYLNEKGERFAARQNWHRKEYTESVINFWHITPAHTFLYTFKPTEKYNGRSEWSESLCYEILADLRSQKPSMNVVRYAVDGQQVFSDMEGKFIPKTPDALKFTPQPDLKAKEQHYSGYEKRVRRAKKKKNTIKRRCQIEEMKAKEQAPYILYGKHNAGGSKEYAWRLTPDKPKRQGIEPGDRVLVWTRFGFKQIIVTRIEAAGDQEQPESRVKKKLLFKDMKRTSEENV